MRLDLFNLTHGIDLDSCYKHRLKALAEGITRIGQRPKKALAKGQISPQELEVIPRSGLYLLVFI